MISGVAPRLWTNRCAAVLVAVALVATAWTPAQAQTRRKSLSEMSDEELREAKFEWESQSAFSGSATGGLIALGPGFFFHGLGHFYAGDPDTGWTLLLGEGIGIAMGLAGFFIVAAVDDNSTFNDVGIGAAHLGATVFATSWFIDVVGALRGNEGELLPPSLTRAPGRATARYRFATTPGIEVGHLLEADLMFDLNVVYVRPRTQQDALLNYQLYGGDLGLRVVEGVDPNDFLALDLTVEWANFNLDRCNGCRSDTQASNPLRVDLTVDVSLDLSTFVSHLEHAVQKVVLGIGFGRDVGGRSFFAGTQDRTWLVYEHHLFINVAPNVVLHPYYKFNEAQLVAPLSSAVGLFGAALHLVPRDGLILDISVAAGDGITTAAGITYELF